MDLPLLSSVFEKTLCFRDVPMNLIHGPYAFDCGISTVLLPVIGIVSDSYTPTQYQTYGVYISTVLVRIVSDICCALVNFIPNVLANAGLLERYHLYLYFRGL